MLILLAILACGCGDDAGVGGRDTDQEADTSEDWFVDVSADVGLDFLHDMEPDGSFFLPQIMGSGGALFDYDNDGDLDIYLVNAGRHGEGRSDVHPNALYRQEADGRFREVAAKAGVDDRGYGMGATVGDYDNDGDLDLLVTNYGPNRLYRNNGDGTFHDVTTAAGIVDEAWSTSAAFFDYDNDGFLDLYIANYLAYDPAKTCRDRSGRPEYCSPQTFLGVPDLLYHNNGDGTFTDSGRAAGTLSTAGKGLGVLTADFNDDGWQDVFVANDGVSNQLWINSGRGTFEDQAFVLGVAVNGWGKPEASMGVALGDANGDLRLDLFVTHIDQETNTLYAAAGKDSYQDASAIAGLGSDSMPYTGFGTGFFDMENDGDLDLLIVNGRVGRPPGVATSSDDPMAGYAQPNFLSLNVGGKRFADHCGSARALCSVREVSRSLMLGDIDRDGDVDALLTNCNGPARLYRNDAPRRGNWLAVRALDGRYSRDAIGSRVYVQADTTWLVRPVTHARSYLAGTDATAHFGLGDARRVNSIVVRWPDGIHERFPSATAGQKIVVTRGRGVPGESPAVGR